MFFVGILVLTGVFACLVGDGSLHEENFFRKVD